MKFYCKLTIIHKIPISLKSFGRKKRISRGFWRKNEAKHYDVRAKSILKSLDKQEYQKLTILFPFKVIHAYSKIEFTIFL